jgi:hypothetical protein
VVLNPFLLATSYHATVLRGSTSCALDWAYAKNPEASVIRDKSHSPIQRVNVTMIETECDGLSIQSARGTVITLVNADSDTADSKGSRHTRTLHLARGCIS